MKTTIILCAIAAVVSTGCSDKKTASKDNFKQIINTYLATNKICSKADLIGLKQIKIVTKGFMAPTEKDGKEFERMRNQIEYLDILTSEGLYELNIVDNTKQALGQARNEYNLTEKGKKTFTGTKNGIDTACALYLEVDEVKNYTEPSSAMGKTISQVMYSYQIKSVEPWVEVVRKKIPTFFIYDKKSFDAKAVLVLLNDGWAHESALR